MSTISQSSLWPCTFRNMLIKFIKSVSFKEAQIAKHLMLLTETFAVKFLQIVVSDVSPTKVLARTLLIELTKKINFCRLNLTKNANLWRQNSTGILLSIKSGCEMQRTFGRQTIYSFSRFIWFVLLTYQWQLAPLRKPTKKKS